MILKKEIQELAIKWGVPGETVDKDYILGHFLSSFAEEYPNELYFKGGTCLRKCYFEGYRFSEDLDFTAQSKDFEFKQEQLEALCQKAESNSGIRYYPEKISPLLHKNELKGFQIRIRYWGANHSRHQAPPPVERWQTKIKLEISTDEIIVGEAVERMIHHPYSDNLSGKKRVVCYTLKEIVAEKLRSLVQRSYTAPRDYYDLYFLTDNYRKKDWLEVKQQFLKKMKHKNLEYEEPTQLVPEQSLVNVKRAWNSSIAHQVNIEEGIQADGIIEEVVRRINENL